MIVFIAHAVFSRERSCFLIKAAIRPGQVLLACCSDAGEVTT